MKCLLDTHFLLWITADAKRIKKYPWLHHYEPWGVSAVSFLETALLAESGKLELRASAFVETVQADPRFVIDDPSLVTVARKSMDLGWTRDPFDRLIAAHSIVRRVPLCSVDALILANHKLVVHELR